MSEMTEPPEMKEYSKSTPVYKEPMPLLTALPLRYTTTAAWQPLDERERAIAE